MKTEDCIVFRLSKANQNAQRMWSKRINRFDVTPVQGMILGFLSEADSVTPRELREKAGIDSATLTGIIDRLESSSLITREKNPEDRRSVVIKLTSDGRKKAHAISRLIEESNREMMSHFSEEEKKLLNNIMDSLRTMRDEDETRGD